MRQAFSTEMFLRKLSLDRNVSDVVQNLICLVIQHAFVTVCSPES